MLRNKYRAFEIRDDQVSQTLVDGNLCSIAEFIRHCDEGSIITLHTMEKLCKVLHCTPNEIVEFTDDPST